MDERIGGRVGERVGLSSGGLDKDGDLGAAENAELGGFLEETFTTLAEGHRPAAFLVDFLNWDLSSSQSFLLGGSQFVHGYQ